ncbi:hypothetical protein OIV83_001419 [Microbotryomycetes sp. JL201]|nr:hypothetical protein OIV83_001419 [Microbotryomycetes sp. JL201]
MAAAGQRPYNGVTAEDTRSSASLTQQSSSTVNQAGSQSQSSVPYSIKYPISSLLQDPNAPLSILPTLPSLSSNAYLPQSITSLGTAFTSAGTLPPSAASSKSVAQRRSQAPPIVVNDVRKVSKSEFDQYLAEVAPAWDRWQRESRKGKQGTADLRHHHQSRPSTSSELGLGITSSKIQDQVPSPPKQLEELPPLDGVPQIFFDPSFNLSNPRTFDLVTERIKVSPNASPALSQDGFDHESASDTVPGVGPSTLADLATDQILQEKLSHYTAIIESHLVREIGLRSSSFFSALSNLQSLHQQGEDTLIKISELQQALSPDTPGVGSSAKRGLRILRAQARRRGLERIEESVRAVEDLWSGVEAVRAMVENGEWQGALEISEQIKDVYYGRSTEESHQRAQGPNSRTDASTSTISPNKAQINFQRIKSLEGVPQKLTLLRAQIAKSLEAEIIAVLEHELDTSIREFMTQNSAWKGKAREDTQPSADTKERTRERIRPVVQGLVRSGGLDAAIAAWRELALREVRSRVRQFLPASDSTPVVEEDDALAQLAIKSVSRSSLDMGTISEKSLSLAKRLRALSHEAFLELCKSTFLALLACIEVVNMHAQVLGDLIAHASLENRDKRTGSGSGNGAGAQTDLKDRQNSLSVPGEEDPSASDRLLSSPTTSSGKEPPSPRDDEAHLIDITDVVHAVAELANLRFSKVLGVRTETHNNLSLAQFLDVFDTTWAFVLRCEQVCQRMIVGLRGVIVGQAKSFLQALHQRRLMESAKLVENEQWVAADVEASTQKTVNLLLVAATSDPPEFRVGDRLSAGSADVSSSETASKEQTKQLDIDGRGYFAVSAGLSTLDMLSDYCMIVVNCPLLVTDTMTRVIEFLKVSHGIRYAQIYSDDTVPQSFNSRTCQVVLGAGAMRSAGLKNITAKNLALASQALSIMISLIPYIRELLRRHLTTKQAVMLTEFDKLKRDYQEHQNEIHAKLVAIMGDRLQVHSRTLALIDWEQPNEKPGPNPWVEQLVKENVTLHRVLSRLLSPDTVTFIMRHVFDALESRLKEEFGKIPLKSDAAKEKLLTDATFLHNKLGDLQGLDLASPGRVLIDLVQSKTVDKPSTPTLSSAAPAQGSNASTTSVGTSRSSGDTPDLSHSDTPARTSLEQPPTPVIGTANTSVLPQSQASTAPPTPDPSGARRSSDAHVAPSPNVPLSGAPAKKKTIAERLAEMAKRGHRPASTVTHPATPKTDSGLVSSATTASSVAGSPVPRSSFEAQPSAQLADGAVSAQMETSAQPTRSDRDHLDELVRSPKPQSSGGFDDRENAHTQRALALVAPTDEANIDDGSVEAQTEGAVPAPASSSPSTATGAVPTVAEAESAEILTSLPSEATRDEADSNDSDKATDAKEDASVARNPVEIELQEAESILAETDTRKTEIAKHENAVSTDETDGILAEVDNLVAEDQQRTGSTSATLDENSGGGDALSVKADNATSGAMKTDIDVEEVEESSFL